MHLRAVHENIYINDEANGLTTIIVSDYFSTKTSSSSSPCQSKIEANRAHSFIKKASKRVEKDGKSSSMRITWKRWRLFLRKRLTIENGIGISSWIKMKRIELYLHQKYNSISVRQPFSSSILISMKMLKLRRNSIFCLCISLPLIFLVTNKMKHLFWISSIEFM